MKTYTLEELRLAQAKGCRIERSETGIIWSTLRSNLAFAFDRGLHLRIHPDDEWRARLPRLADGVKWHRDDFTNEMLEGGFRPLLVNELDDQRHADIEWLPENDTEWLESDDGYYAERGEGMGSFRTRRPVPSEFLHESELAAQWCPMCAAYTDHGSGACPQLAKRIPSKERGCDGKANLGSDYTKQADRMAAKHGKQYGVYHCPHCGGHHLTTKLENQGYYAPLLYVTQPESTPSTPAPDYGEPWNKEMYNTELGNTGDYEGHLEIFDRNNGRRVAECCNPDDENEADFDRIIACVNSMAGVPDPAEFVRQAIATEARVKELEGRLQIDPGGSDKIDELESAINFLKDTIRASDDKVKELEAARRLRPIAEAGPVPDGAVRLWAVCYDNKWFFSYGNYGATTHFIDIYPPQQ